VGTAPLQIHVSSINQPFKKRKKEKKKKRKKKEGLGDHIRRRAA
jgi:hypothetical protein